VRVRLASTNDHKLEELRSALSGWQVEPLELELPPEDGSTYEENALLKARFARPHAAGDEWVVADDSGVEAEALRGRPGVASARWSTTWIETMLAELEGQKNRRGRYVCVLAALSPRGVEVVVRGELPGTFAEAPRGREGFGYDPIFVPEGESRTVAELGNAWKQEHSHRAHAARALQEAVAQTPTG
jgi:XTP/dITP diphosphohydrolase